ncbi:MAG TPA: hypothetical protein HA286_04610 [Candidatus Poseidoniaceae archaeon]|nr:MAG TPA: hypothetical protein D7H96_04545 [Candidatus Poseidoniales archaeon]HIH53543.1 hypothetical protein [Candidatus Poseidoniaceae archaeon]
MPEDQDLVVEEAPFEVAEGKDMPVEDLPLEDHDETDFTGEEEDFVDEELDDVEFEEEEDRPAMASARRNLDSAVSTVLNRQVNSLARTELDVA